MLEIEPNFQNVLDFFNSESFYFHLHFLLLTILEPLDPSAWNSLILSKILVKVVKSGYGPNKSDYKNNSRSEIPKIGTAESEQKSTGKKSE